MPREFPIEDVLSITDGRLLCEMGRVYAILNYLTGDNLLTHQLPRAAEECQPDVIRQHPRLDPAGPELTVPLGTLTLCLESCPKEEVPFLIQGWLEKHVYPAFGRTVSLEPVPKADHARISPVIELQMMTDKPIMVVSTGEGN